MCARLALFLAALLLALPSSNATAAPQLLGLVASNGPVPLLCNRDHCTAELSSFCLQEDRPVPPAGTGYSPAPGLEVTLRVTAADGSVRRLNAGHHLGFASVRNYTAVEVSLPVEALAALGAVAAAVEIGPGLALVPEPRAGDPLPQSSADVSFATEIRRTAGTRLVDLSQRAGAARVLGLIVNRLSPEDHDRVTPRDRLWREALAQAGQDREAPGLARAEGAFGACLNRKAPDNDAALRWCLQLRHDALMIGLTSDYWAAAKGGS